MDGLGAADGGRACRTEIVTVVLCVGRGTSRVEYLISCVDTKKFPCCSAA